MNYDVISREYSEEFDRLRKNRVEVAFYKYGAARDNFGSGRVDALVPVYVPAAREKVLQQQTASRLFTRQE